MLIGNLPDHILYTGTSAPPNSAPVPSAGGTSTAANSITVPLTAKVNDIAVIVVTHRNSATLSVSTSGWSTMAGGIGPNSGYVLVVWRKLVAGDIGNPVTFAGVGGSPIFVIETYSDTDGAAPANVTSTASGSAFAVLSGLAANSRVVYVAATSANSSNSPASISGITDQAGANGSGLGTEAVVGSETVVAGGSNPARTGTFPGIGAGFLVTFSLKHNPAATAVDGATFLDKTNRRFYGQMSGGGWGTSLGLRHNDPVAKTAAYTAADGDVVLADATAAAFTVTLPAAVAGAKVTVKKTDSSVHAVTVSAATGTIDGATSLAIATQWDRATFLADGVNWFVISGGSVRMQVAAKATRTLTTFQLTTVGYNQIAWDGVAFDTHGFWSSGNPSRLTVPAGQGKIYTVGFGFNTPDGWTASKRILAEIRKNGTMLAQMEIDTSMASSFDSPNAITTVQLVAGDYVEGYLYQNDRQPINMGNTSALWLNA